jgi:hypothetical protein
MHGKFSFTIVVLTGLIVHHDRVVAADSFRSYLSQHDIIYQRPPMHPRDGFPIGNRTLAGMVYHEQGNYKVLLAKDDVWDHRTAPLEDVTAGYDHQRVLKLLANGQTDSLDLLPGSRFMDKWTGPREQGPGWMPYPAPKIAGWVTVEAEENDFREQRLRLAEAVVESNYQRIDLKAWVAATDNIFILEIDPKERSQFALTFERPACAIMGTAPVFEKQSNGMTMTYPFPDGFAYSAAVRLIGADAEVEITDSGARFELDTSHTVTLMISVVSSLDRNDHQSAAQQSIKHVDAQQLRRLAVDHQRQWDDYWSKSRIQLSDKLVENVWYFNIYQMGASYSPTYSGGLCGPFFALEPAPWQNDLHEVNESFRFYSIHAANHPELGNGFVETYSRMIPQVRDFTQRFYGFDGLRFPHACGYSGKEREAIPGAFRYMYMQCASGLIANIAWWQYEFTQDREDLQRRIYPIVKGAAQFYVNYMTRGTDGRYHIYPTFSPEQKPSLWSRDATIDLAMARYTLRAAIRAADILAVDAELQAAWKDRLENIAPYPADAVGIQEMEGDQRDYLFGHTAIIHCVHPAAEYRLKQPVYQDLLKQTQDRLGLYDGATFSKAHLAMSAAWLHQSNKAWDLLYDGVLAMYLKPNGFVSLNRVSPERNKDLRDNLTKQGAAGAIFQDVSAGAVGTVNEMLLQSQLGSIHVFPALPDTVDAAFEQLRARGAFLVSSARRQGEVQFVEVQAVSGGLMKLVNPWPQTDVVSSDPRIQWPSGQDVVELPMAVGQRITFHPAGMIPQRTVWSGRPATAPRSVVRVIQEKMPAGRRNDPLQPLIKYADQCTIWLGAPGAKMLEER